MPYIEDQSDNCESAIGQNKMINQFCQLVQDLCDVLGPSSGIDSADVDIEHLKLLMKQYTSDERHWSPYALADPSTNYTRNLVHEGNGKSNLLVVVWNPGKSSPIHDHANAHCVMKVLRGELQETIYTVPASCTQLKTMHFSSPEGIPCTQVSALSPLRSTTYQRNEVTYISDEIGLHKIKNPTSEIAVSLHLYTPPHAVNLGFNLFDEKTGKARHITQANYFSKYGKLLDKGLHVSM